MNCLPTITLKRTLEHMLTTAKHTATHFRHVMDVERKMPAPGGWEGGKYPWRRVARLRCKQSPQKATEREVAASQTATQRVVIDSRWHSGILTTDRLRNASTGVLYAIESVENVEGESRYVRIIAVISNHE